MAHVLRPRRRPPRLAGNLPPWAVDALGLVREECLDYAVPRSELVGIWGGTSARERATRLERAA